MKSFMLLVFSAICLHISTVVSLSIAQPGFSPQTIDRVRTNMLQVSTESWEIGTGLEALTELEWPSLSVFQQTAFPPPRHLSPGEAADVLNITTTVVKNKAPSALPLIDGDGAVGDPASIGTSVLLANWTRTDLGDYEFANAAAGQLEYLLHVAPRTDDGAISQREDEVQLWADFVYMAPPFIAYYGALQGGQNGSVLLQEAYDQCRLYRQYLRDPKTNLWKHIILGDWNDLNLWGTGNAWAAAGMLRVLETIRHSDHSRDFKQQQDDLTSWVKEIVTAAWSFQKPNGTLYNYINETDTSFADSASTALLAASTYRLASLTGDSTLIPAANKALRLVEASVNATGWLKNTVDPLTFSSPAAAGGESPEGQSFVLLLHSAWRDYNSFFTRYS